MSIRIRSKKGEVKTLDDDFQFIEITDVDGKVGIAFYKDAVGGISQITAGSQEAKRYKKLFNVDFCPVINIKV